MTEEEAKKIADKTAAGLELLGMEATAWEPVVEVLCARSGAPGKDDIMDYGYVFHYTRRLCGMPVTYTMIPGGSLAETDSDGFAWGYETLDVYVTKEGVDEIRFENQYEIGTAEIEPVKLLAFSDIMEVFETMTAVRESDVLVDRRAEQGDFAAPAYARTYHIDRITLGYTRIYDPCAKSKSGVFATLTQLCGIIGAPGGAFPRLVRVIHDHLANTWQKGTYK